MDRIFACQFVLAYQSPLVSAGNGQRVQLRACARTGAEAQVAVLALEFDVADVELGMALFKSRPGPHRRRAPHPACMTIRPRRRTMRPLQPQRVGRTASAESAPSPT